jgi:hypothetical protein
MRFFKYLPLVVCAAVLTAAPATAQVSTGEIFGKVTDGTGAVLPGVAVTLSGTALIQPQTAITVESGAYRFPRIPIGTYAVSFELAGFKKTVRDGVVIQAGFNAEIDARLELSTVQETVTVSGRVRSSTRVRRSCPRASHGKRSKPFRPRAIRGSCCSRRRAW